MMDDKRAAFAARFTVLSWGSEQKWKQPAFPAAAHA